MENTKICDFHLGSKGVNSTEGLRQPLLSEKNTFSINMTTDLPDENNS